MNYWEPIKATAEDVLRHYRSEFSDAPEAEKPFRMIAIVEKRTPIPPPGELAFTEGIEVDCLLEHSLTKHDTILDAPGKRIAVLSGGIKECAETDNCVALITIDPPKTMGDLHLVVFVAEGGGRVNHIVDCLGKVAWTFEQPVEPETMAVTLKTVFNLTYGVDV